MFEKTAAPLRIQTYTLTVRGVFPAVLSAILLGFTPIFGKLAIQNGVSPLFVVTIRTVLATLFMAITLLFTDRKNFYIYPAGLMACALAGTLNGIGSLFYYLALSMINANLGQLIFLTYPVFVTLWMVFDHYKPSSVSLLRLALIILGIVMLIYGIHTPVHLRGILFMLIAAACYGSHLPINQRVLYEMPAPTVTFYTLLFMSLAVIPSSLLTPQPLQLSPEKSLELLPFFPVLALALVTFLSRLTLFLGVKRIGGLQTALLGVTEVLVTLSLAKLWLSESFNLVQWVGALLIVLSLLLVGFEKPPQRQVAKPTMLHWLQHFSSKAPPNPPRID